MHRRRLAMLAAGSALVASTAAAPAAVSEGSAVEVEGVATIGGSSADSDGSSSGTAVAVGGETVSGGEQQGDGSSSGEIAGTGETERGEATVGGWRASNDGSTSHGASSAASARSADGQTGVRALGSSSDADADGARAESSALEVWLGGHHLTVLGAETSTDRDGGSYLADADGERVGTSEDADGRCAVDASPAVRLNCLMAATFSGDLSGEEARVLGAEIAPDEDTPVGGVDLVAARSGAAPDAGDPADETTDDTTDGRTEGPTRVLSGETLPRTGGGLGIGLLGLASVLSGTILRRRR